MSFAVWKDEPPFVFSKEDAEQVYQVGAVWVVTDDPQKGTQAYLDSLVNADHNAAIDAQIAALEVAAGGYNRGTREFMLGIAVILDAARAAANANPALAALAPAFPDIKPTPGMVRIKALDDQIKALRAQRLP